MNTKTKTSEELLYEVTKNLPDAEKLILVGLYEPDFETVVGYRAMDTSRMDGAQEREYRRLQTAYELHKPGDCAAGGVIDWDAWAADKMRRLSGGE